jgi:hypothetical protein
MPSAAREPSTTAGPLNGVRRPLGWVVVAAALVGCAHAVAPPPSAGPAAFDQAREYREAAPTPCRLEERAASCSIRLPLPPARTASGFTVPRDAFARVFPRVTDALCACTCPDDKLEVWVSVVTRGDDVTVRARDDASFRVPFEDDDVTVCLGRRLDAAQPTLEEWMRESVSVRVTVDRSGESTPHD